jgi:hypothetical protein
MRPIIRSHWLRGSVSAVPRRGISVCCIIMGANTSTDSPISVPVKPARLMENSHMQPPARSAHTLASHGLAKAVLVTSTIGVLTLVLGLTSGSHSMIGVSCAVLLTGIQVEKPAGFTFEPTQFTFI